ncbi:hypothetical protein [Sulfurimonas sp.]|uniref:hypothetical protein n=1 Tax=Sulfurimonas sp. TaxID=2022749 RepID=UPI002AB15EB7|nr:hypothetical protein [Sulfurimonas sp.]
MSISSLRNLNYSIAIHSSDFKKCKDEKTRKKIEALLDILRTKRGNNLSKSRHSKAIGTTNDSALETQIKLIKDRLL